MVRLEPDIRACALDNAPILPIVARSLLTHGSPMDDTNHRIYGMSVASVYKHYVAKAERKGRTKAELDQIICWLTGHNQASLDSELENLTTFQDFFARAPQMNPARSLITGLVCGVRVQDIAHPLMREIRYIDKLVDELANGKKMEKILRA